MKNNKTTINDCKLIDLPKMDGARQGSLTYVQGEKNIPFNIERIYYLYDVPGGAERAGHAHKKLQQIMISVSGSFDVLLDDGQNKKHVFLSRPYFGLYIPRLVWRELVNFSSGSVCLVLASLPYDKDDYLSEYESFIEYKKNQ